MFSHASAAIFESKSSRGYNLHIWSTHDVVSIFILSVLCDKMKMLTSLMLKFTERPKTPGITSKKTWLSLKGISCLQLIFVLIWMKQTLIWFNLQRHGTGNGLPNLNLHQKMRIFKAGLSSLYDVVQNKRKNS